MTYNRYNDILEALMYPGNTPFFATLSYAFFSFFLHLGDPHNRANECHTGGGF